MIKIKKKSSDYDKILFVSDTHYGHDRDFLYIPRGFTNSADHDQWILNQITSITPNSLLIHVGDVGLTIGAERISEFLNKFPCETLMVYGNHNSGVYQLYQQNLPKGFEKCQLYPMKITPNVTLLGYEFLLDIDYHRFYVRHMASLIWPDMNKNRNHICGHSHGNLKAATPGVDGFGKMLDVGVENAFKYNGTAFFTLDEVNKIMNEKNSSHFDHH